MGQASHFKLSEMVILNKKGSGDDEKTHDLDNSTFSDYLYEIGFNLFNLKNN